MSNKIKRITRRINIKFTNKILSIHFEIFVMGIRLDKKTIEPPKDSYTRIIIL